MKNAGIVLFALALTACSTTRSGHESDPPSLVPPAETSASASAVSDARLSELQTSMTELLERLDVLNARIAHLEAGPAPEPRITTASGSRADNQPAPMPIPRPAAPVSEPVAESTAPENSSPTPRALHS
ncbi:MAG: hypothetical protein ABIP63_08365, partial [Thermoanaerobaculia bacterium]